MGAAAAGDGLVGGKASRLGAITASSSLVVMVLMVLIAGAFTRDYIHVSQFISGLGARGAPHEWSVRLAGFLPAGVLLLSFCWFANSALPRAGGLVIAGYAAAGFAFLGLFTLSPSSPIAGLSQRLLEASVLFWVALCGRYLARRGTGGA